MLEVVVIALVAWALLDAARDLTMSRKELMRRERERNQRRGITMRPGFRYLDPDGTWEVREK